jgi:nitroreductase
MMQDDDGSEVISLLNRRASVRDFRTDDVSDRLLEKILDAARQAPTSSNAQAYSLVVVRSEETRRSLADIAGGQQHVATAPVMVAVCADLHRLGQLCAEHEEVLDGSLCELNMIAVIDAALVGMCASLAADSVGLGSVLIGGLRNDPVAVSEVLGLPENVFCPFGLCIGWPASTPPAKPRLPGETVVFREQYNKTYSPQHIQDYDQALTRYYAEMGKDSPVWSDRVAAQFSHPHRAELYSALEKLGFTFR